MNRSVLFAVSCLAISSLLTHVAHGDDKPAVAAGQGVTGKVLKFKGNMMPGPTEPGVAAPPARAGAPLAVPVHIFKGKVVPFAKPDPKHPALVQIVQAGKDGVYKLALPPGEYTAVAEIKGQMYLNLQISAEGTTYWYPVEVSAGRWTTFNIEETSEASF
jgi:hypothetical protein